MGTRLGDNHNISKKKGTRVDTTASDMLPCRSLCGASFLTHASHHAAAGRCVNPWRATSSSVRQRGCRTNSTSDAILSHWMWSWITYILRDGRELSRLCRDGQRLKLLVPCAQALNPSCRAHMTRRTTVDQHKLSSVVDPYHQIPKTTHTRQRGDGSSRRAQLSFLAPKDHFGATHLKAIAILLATNIATDSIGYRTSTISKVTRSVPAIDGTCSLRTQCPYDVRARPLAVRKSDSTHLKAIALVQILPAVLRVPSP